MKNNNPNAIFVGSLLVSVVGVVMLLADDFGGWYYQISYAGIPTAPSLSSMSRKTRHEVLDMLEREGTVVSAGHFPDPGFGHFVRVEGRRWWKGL